jgi:hypothetical protein
MDENEKLDYFTPPRPGQEKLVTIATFQTGSDAQPLRIALEEAGIPVFVADDNVVTALSLGPALGYVKVQVPASEVEAAAEIATQHVPAPGAPETDDGVDRPTKCLACGAEMPEDSDTCPKCGWTFNVADVEADQTNDLTDR